jgi:hypothetical protein
MVVKINEKSVKIPDETIKKYIDKLSLTKDEAIALYLEEEGYQVNAEYEELDKKAKQVKILKGAKAETSSKPRKPRTVKISDEKQELFAFMQNALIAEYSADNVKVIKENKLFTVAIGDKVFKIDLIEQRKPTT